jgi:vanillate/3-O-methylgallate O-demethylase
VNWLQFQAETGGFKVDFIRDDRSPSAPRGKAVSRRRYRFQVQGPNAWKVLERLNGGPIPDIKFFNWSHINVGGVQVKALRHGMAGAPGLELWGPYADYDRMFDTILEAGQPFGIVPVGARAYGSNTLESGWIPSPLPAVYSGESMKKYREWLPANGYEATCSICGSFVSNDIRDYYTSPYDLGYGPFVKFDHDFAGREALEKIAAKPETHRKKVTFAWNGDDIAKTWASMLRPGERAYKYFESPIANYGSASFDAVYKGDRIVGYSMFGGYSYNERAALSLGVVNQDVQIGEELTLVWGEADNGSAKPTVERHKQLDVRVQVATVPYGEDARKNYAAGWRTRK